VAERQRPLSATQVYAGSTPADRSSLVERQSLHGLVDLLAVAPEGQAHEVEILGVLGPERPEHINLVGSWICTCGSSSAYVYGRTTSYYVYEYINYCPSPL
jgi:hypothetical protein